MIYTRMDGIRYRRKAAGLGVSAAAERLGVTRQAWYQWELGKSLPGSGCLPAMAELLQCRIEDLYVDPDAQPMEPTRQE